MGASNSLQPGNDGVPRRTIRVRSWADLCALVLAGVALPLARLALAWVPVRWLVGQPAGQRRQRAVCGASAQQKMRRVQWAIGAVVRRAPMRFVCFPQCLAGRWMLGWCGLATRLHYGVTRTEGRLETHTWLECEGQIVLGGEECGRFVAVAVY